ncbi:MAG: hypothetical protein DRJ40_08600 [Thermoprotei archaeon]|nr:MAG: hypothetical protein DRJ40_08600 [Thermoprotei archaeon]
MSTWKLHRFIGEKLLGYSNPEIDKLVDCVTLHDVTRYNIEALVKVVEGIVYPRYGEIGLKYFTLHHFLDRIIEIEVKKYKDYLILSYYASHISNLPFSFTTYTPPIYSRPEYSACGLVEDIMLRIGRDPCNVLTLFVARPEEIKHIIYLDYRGRVRKMKLTRLKEAIEKLKQLGCSHGDTVVLLRRIIREVLSLVCGHIVALTYLTLVDKSFNAKIQSSFIKHYQQYTQYHEHFRSSLLQVLYALASLSEREIMDEYCGKDQ